MEICGMRKEFSDAIRRHQRLVSLFEEDAYSVIREIIDRTIGCFERGNTLYLMGNGGSAADCQHIAGELVGRYQHVRDPLPAIALTSDSSVLTCIGNDYGYQEVFSRATAALAGPDDLIWAFSTSGASENVLNAVRVAKERGTGVIAFTGSTHSPLEKLADVTLCSRTDDTARAQEIHQLAYHIICETIDRHFSGDADRK